MNQIAGVACPVCQADSPKQQLYRYSAAQAASHFCPKTRSREDHESLLRCIRGLWNGDESLVLQCDDCGFAFGHPFVGGDEEFYSILHKNHGYSKWTWDFEFARTTVVDRLAGGRALDIGAGVGNFLRSLDPRWDRYAAEGSETTRRHLEQHGITVFRDLDTAVQNEAGTFTVITMFQVLEHIATFRDVLNSCRELMSPDGRLVVTVPDGDAMLRQERVTGLPDMVPNHINKWTPGSLKMALRQAGLETVDVAQQPPSWRNLRNSLAQRLLADASQKPSSLAARVYRNPNRRIRIMMLASLAPLALVRMLPHLSDLRSGGAFAVVAKRADQ